MRRLLWPLVCLSLGALATYLLVSIPLGVLTAKYRDRPIDRVTLVLVGRKNGLPFAATTASVVLASGCSSTTVQLGGTPFATGLALTT